MVIGQITLFYLTKRKTPKEIGMFYQYWRDMAYGNVHETSAMRDETFSILGSSDRYNECDFITDDVHRINSVHKTPYYDEKN